MTATPRPTPDTTTTGVSISALEADPTRYVVLGLGNRIQGDEALGALAIEALESGASGLASLPDPASVRLLDGGTIGLALLPLLCDLGGLIVVDIIDADVAPGTLLDLDGADVMRRNLVLSVHDLGAEELLGALFVMDQLPARVRVIGLQPERIGLGLELSASLAPHLPELLAAVIGHLRAWQETDATEG